MRERAAAMAEVVGDPDDRRRDVGAWATKMSDGLHPQPANIPPKPQEPGVFGSTKRYHQRLLRYYGTYDSEYFARVEVKKWLTECSELLLRDVTWELGQPAVNIPVASATVEGGVLLWVSQGGRPGPMLTCSPRQAEFLAKAWMEYLGATGCNVSQATRDGGIDVESDDFVGEVKHHAESVSPAIVRQIVESLPLKGRSL
ncbi:hypothetical protein [Paenarthrobacter nitroguajacolicus]